MRSDRLFASSHFQETAMEHKAVQFEVVQMTNPWCWKWTVFLDATRMRTGIALTRADALLDVELAIEKELQRRTQVLDAEKAMRPARSSIPASSAERASCQIDSNH
jgi:hypothetical protein